MSQLALTENVEVTDREPQKDPEKENAEAAKEKEVKKRKAMAPRSEAWNSFTKIFEKDSDVVKEAKCNYCNIIIKCDCINDGKQPVLQAISEDGSRSSITDWRFDPEMLREAFSEILITDELPFAFADRPGFFMVKGHRADDIGKDLERCLVDWGLDGVFTITVDNASANNGAVSCIARILNKSKTSILEAMLLHMRCAAHIVNLIVQDGLKELDLSVKRIRLAVKFIKSSPARIAKFKKCAELEKVDTKAFLCLDVFTRWNSTYAMLKVAVAYEKVFERYAEDDPYYVIDLTADKQPGVPDSDDWARAAKMVEFLEHFQKLTLRVSATLCPTAHIFFHEVAELNILLRSWCESSDLLRKEMAKRMLAVKKMGPKPCA
ncbi:hypothetical protein U9M48_043807 [Paspalum notatum var. saurae]|uniref:Uncharacterized protein n=1 Tax=Paspalum notatum var. saurae TaxID=547442 RepID=A0AAQ3XHP6_PASNO